MLSKKKIKWSIIGISAVSAPLFALPFILKDSTNNLQFSAVAKRATTNSSTTNNASSTTGSTTSAGTSASSASVVNYRDKFFKIYETPGAAKTIDQMGPISAVKISGLPFITTSKNGVDVKEIDLKSVNIFTGGGTGVPVMPTFTTLDASSPEQLMTKTENAPAIKVSNISSPQAVELNYQIDKSQIRGGFLSDITLNLNASQNQSTWHKIGSVSILTESGEVYRADNIDLNSISIPGAKNDGSVPNISLKNISKWVHWEKSTTPRDSSAFMWSYDQSDGFKVDLSNSVYFYDGIWTRRSLTPIISGGRVDVSYFDPRLNDVTQINLSTQLTIQQEIAFLKEVDDNKFQIDLMSQMSQSLQYFNHLDEQFLTWWDTSAAKNEYQDNSRDWDLNIIFDGSASAIDRTSLSNLSVFGVFKNLRKIDFASSVFLDDADSWYDVNINDIYWVSGMEKLEEINFPGRDSKNWSSTNSGALLTVTGDLPKSQWLSTMPKLESIDISAFAPLAQTNMIDQMNGSTWALNLPLDFTFYLPKGIYATASNNPILNNVYTVTSFQKTNFTPEYTILKKKIASNFIAPKLIQNPNYHLNSNQDRYIFNSIKVDGMDIDVMVRDGKLYWNFSSRGIDPADISYIGRPNEYYTSAYVTANNIDVNTLKGIGQTSDYFGNLAISLVSLQNEGQLTVDNYSSLTNTITVDDQQVDQIVYQSKIMYRTDISKIKYYTVDAAGAVKYYTSLDKVVASVGFDAFENSPVFDIRPNTNNLIYANYEALPKADLTVVDPQPYVDNQYIKIDGQQYDAIIVNGKTMWNLKNIKIEDIKFKDTSTNEYYTSPFDENGDVISSLVSVIPHAAYAFQPTIEPALTSLGPIRELTDIEKKISIDGKEIGVILANGNIEYAGDVTSAKIIRRYVDDGKVKYEYFSAFSKIPSTIPLSELSSMAQSQTVPPYIQQIKNALNVTQGANEFNVTIDDKTYDVKLRNGKFYWDVPKEVFEKIQYMDADGKYYTALTTKNFGNIGMTKVGVLYEPLPENKNFSFPKELNKDSYKLANSGITVGDRAFRFIIDQGQMYIGAQARSIINFATKDTQGNEKFYFSFADIPASDLPFAWSVDVDLTSASSDKLLPAPDERNAIISPFQPLIVFDENGKRITVEILYNKDQRKYFYTNLDLLRKIRFVDNKGNYYEKLSDGMNFEGMSSIDISKSNLVETAVPINKNPIEVTKSSKEIGKYVAIFGGAIAGSAVLSWGVLSFIRRKGTK